MKLHSSITQCTRARVVVVGCLLFLMMAPSEARVRRSYQSFTPQERQDFVDAVKWLKNNSTTYDEFVELHHANFNTGALHTGPAFLAWHREYLLRFENALRTANGGAWSNTTIPYWDSAEDPFPSHKVDANLDNQFLGGNGDPPQGTVSSGPFAFSTTEWNLVIGPTADLRRGFGDWGPLPTPGQVSAALGTSPFDSPDWNGFVPSTKSLRAAIERVHNSSHVWVGGTMLMTSSPNDPVFWMHHANIDRLWCKWQEAHSIDLHHLPLCGTHDPLERPRPQGLKVGHCVYDDLTGYTGVTPWDVINLRASGVEYDDCQGPCVGDSGQTTSQYMIATET